MGFSFGTKRMTMGSYSGEEMVLSAGVPVQRRNELLPSDIEEESGEVHVSPRPAPKESHTVLAVLLSALIALVGVGAGVAFLAVGIQDVRDDQSREFAKQADEITKSIETTWQEFAVTSLWMHETCHSEIGAAIGCTRQEFADYFRYTTHSQLDPISVFWLANVTHEDRQAVEAESRQYFATHHPEVNYSGFIEAAIDETGNFGPVPLEEKPWYFVKHHNLPSTPNSLLFADHDIHTSAFLWSYAEAAVKDRKPKLTRRLPKFQDPTYYVQMFHPGIDFQEEPIHNGIAGVMVSIYHLLRRAVSSKLVALNVYLYDITPKELQAGDGLPQFMSGVQILGAQEQEQDNVMITQDPSTETPTAVGATIITEIDYENATLSSNRFHETEIHIEDRIWLVLVTDPQDIYKASLFAPIFAGSVIMAATIIIAVWFYTNTRKAAEIQRNRIQAEAEKAALLETVNQDLNQQVEQRAQELRLIEEIANKKKKEAQQAEARSESMIQTMSMLSHELRTPLQGIMGITSMALNDALNPSSTSSCSHTAVSTITDADAFPRTHPNGGVSVDSLSHSTWTANNTLLTNLNTIQASSQQLLTLINNMLDVRKISTGMMERFELECIDIGLVIEQCVSILLPLSDLSDVNLKTCPGVDQKKHWLARGSVLPVQQVLVNLVGNAIKYSSASLDKLGEPIDLDINIRWSTLGEARREATNALCSSSSLDQEDSVSFQDQPRNQEVLIVDVRDRGQGIPEEEADKVFAEFLMLKKHVGSSKGFAQPTGSGLGMHLVSSMMNMMGGCVWGNNCYSPKASKALAASGAPTGDCNGCVFSFYLECPPTSEVQKFLSRGKMVDSVPSGKRFLKTSKSQDSEENSSFIAPPQCSCIPCDRTEAAVLVVDDILINVKVIARMLQRMGYKNVRCATSGTRALKMLEEDPACHWILTDYQMPDMDGIQFAAAVSKFYSDTCTDKRKPFINLCTADYSSIITTKCNEVGIDGILRKPVTLPILLEYVSENEGIVQ